MPRLPTLVRLLVCSWLASAAGCGDVDQALLSAADAPGDSESPARVVVDLGAPAHARNKGATDPFVAMSLNVRIPHRDDQGERTWANRKGLINSMLRRFNGGVGPEIIGLQELYGWTNEELSALLPHYFRYMVDRGDGEVLAIYVQTARFEVLHRAYRNTTNAQRDDLCDLVDAENHANRPIMFVRLKDRVTGRTVSVYNTHYPSKNSCERHGMSKIVAAYIAQNDPDGDVVMLGDLNDGVEGDGRLNGSYARLLSATGLHNAFAAVRPMDASTEFSSGATGWSKTERHSRMIDHVLISSGIGVHDADVNKTMFTPDGLMVDCPALLNLTCVGSSWNAEQLRLYSDHWASWALLWQP
ncbi:MAG: endonuclease/exonuclease/phosphatase family protein [Polyangiales bacterium]